MDTSAESNQQSDVERGDDAGLAGGESTVSPTTEAVETVFREFMVALVTEDSAKITQLALPHPDLEVLFRNPKSVSDIQRREAIEFYRTSPVVHHSIGDHLRVSATEVLVLDEGHVNENRQILNGLGESGVVALRSDGNWRIDADSFVMIRQAQLAIQKATGSNQTTAVVEQGTGGGGDTPEEAVRNFMNDVSKRHRDRLLRHLQPGAGRDSFVAHVDDVLQLPDEELAQRTAMDIIDQKTVGEFAVIVARGMSSRVNDSQLRTFRFWCVQAAGRWYLAPDINQPPEDRSFAIDVQDLQTWMNTRR